MTLSAIHASIVLAVAGACYENHRSGELVSAAMVHSEVVTGNTLALPGDMLVADEYGGLRVMTLAQFNRCYRPAIGCFRDALTPE